MLKLNEKIDKRLSKLYTNRKTTCGRIMCSLAVGMLEGVMDLTVIYGTVIGTVMVINKLKRR